MGKGSRQRPAQISEAELDKRWRATFEEVYPPTSPHPDWLAAAWERYKNRPGSAAKLTWGEWVDLGY